LLQLESQLSGNDAAHIEQIFDELLLSPGVALDHLARLFHVGGGHRSHPH
jgi:hypothetical protein